MASNDFMYLGDIHHPNDWGTCYMPNKYTTTFGNNTPAPISPNTAENTLLQTNYTEIAMESQHVP